MITEHINLHGIIMFIVANIRWNISPWNATVFLLDEWINEM